MIRGSIKRKVMIGSAFALIICIACLALPMLSASAVSETKEIVSDNFNRTDSESNWLENSFDIHRENYSLQYGNSGFGSGMTLTKYKVEKSCTVSYKIQARSSGPYSGFGFQWVGLQVGLGNLSMTTSQAGAMFVSYPNGHTGIMDHEDGSKANLTNESIQANQTYPGGIGAFVKENGVACVELKLTRRDPEAENGKDAAGRVLYDAEYRVWKDGTQRPGGALDWGNKGVGADGYLAFGGIIESGFVRIYDFLIKEGEDTVFDAEFGKDIDGKIGGRTADWCARDIPLEDCVISADSYVDTAAVSTGLLLSATELGVDPYMNKQFDLSFDVDCELLAQNASFGVGFGLSPLSKTPDERNYIGVKGTADGEWKFVMTYGGKDRASSVAFDAFPSGMQKLRFEGFYDGTVKVTFGGESETFKNIDFTGNFALATLGAAASGAKFDNVSLSVTSCKELKSTAEDRTIDFTGVRKIVDGESVYETAYIDSTKWYSGTNVRLARDGGKYVQFASATETSAFGPRSRYADFICRFSVTASQNRNVVSSGAAIGLSFGRRSFYSSNTASAAIFFEKTEEGMKMRVLNASCKEVPNGAADVPDMDIWSSSDVAHSPVTYNFAVVVLGGVAEVYFAPSTSDAAEMQTVRATLTNFDGYGFVAVAGRSGSAFRLNNMSVISLDRSKADTPSTATASERINFTGNSAKTQEKYTNFIMYAGVTNGDAEVSFGGNNSLKFKTDGTIETTLAKISGEGKFEASDLADGVIYVEAMGDTVKVGVSARVAPEEFVHRILAVYDCENAAGEIKVTGNMKEGYMNVYSLAPAIEIEPDDWEEGDGDYPVKPDRDGKESIDTGKTDGGCSSSVAGGSLFLAGLVLAIAAILTIYSKKNRMGVEKNDKE